MRLPYKYVYGNITWEVIDMNIRQLQYFCETAQTENIAMTADKYTVPPSTVSVAIKHLEEELGVRLFDRSSNKIRLNAKGNLLAAELQASFDKVDAVIRQIKEETIPHSQIKVLIRARPKWITELIAQYKAQNSNISFVISNDYTITDIDNFDVIIDEDAKQYRQWARFLLSSEIICVKAASDNPLAHKTLSFQDLKGEVFILPSVGNGMRNLYERICKKNGIIPNVAIECNDRQCLQYYVQANMGLTLGAYRALEDHTQTNMTALRVTDFNETQSVYVFYRENVENYTNIKPFCDFLYEQRYL